MSICTFFFKFFAPSFYLLSFFLSFSFPALLPPPRQGIRRRYENMAARVDCGQVVLVEAAKTAKAAAAAKLDDEDAEGWYSSDPSTAAYGIHPDAVWMQVYVYR